MTLLSSGAPGARPTARRRRVDPAIWIPVATAAAFLAAALWPSLLASHDPLATDLDSVLQPPSPSHWLGTDNVGRDLYSRIVWGTRPSLLIGLGVMALGLTLAVVLGFVSGLGSRWISEPVNRLLEILLAFPTLLLALLFVALLGPSVSSLIISVGISTAPGYARLIRAQTISVKTSGYVEAARALGHSPGTILRQHIAPNAFRPLVALVALGIGTSVVWASGLSFLGLGVAPPSSEWGLLLNEGKTQITVAWWLEIFPGVAIVLVALSFTLIGRYLQNLVEGDVP